MSGFLAWRQYQDNEHRAVTDLNARVVLVGAVVNSYLEGGISTLSSIAAAPSVMASRRALMSGYFRRAGVGTIFTGGIAWVDRAGRVAASSSAGPAVNVSDRLYFKDVLATGRPYVSAGLVGRRLHQQVIVVAVPTHDAADRLTGVLTGAIRLTTLAQSRLTSDLGFQDLQIIDRNGHLLRAGLAPIKNRQLLAQIKRLGSGDLTDTPGLGGGTNHVIAFSTATVPHWTIVIDRRASSLYAAARRSLLFESLLLATAVAGVLVILGLLAKRSRRDIETGGEQAQSWGRLTRSLAQAATPADVADVVLVAVQAVFPDAVIVVAVDSETGEEIRTTLSLPGWRRVSGDATWLHSVAALALAEPGSRSLKRDRSLRGIYLAFGRRLKALHGLPIVAAGSGPVGGIALLTERSRLAQSEWELLGAFGAQAARSLERARAFEHEHELAARLQQSFLPTELPSAPGFELAGEYLAGGAGVEVGGDWYDAVRRPDGILQLSVGDVSGRGVGAATVMGRLRGTFRAYAYDCVSPAEVLRRMLRHVNNDEMVTAVCVSIDQLAGTLTYSSAGHPPPLLLDCNTGTVTRLESAGSPPLGVAEPGDIVEEELPLPERARLALYSDGLVERRGESIDHGIEILGSVLSKHLSLTSHETLEAITEEIGAPTDDVALLLGSLGPVRAFSLELPARPDVLGVVRGRLRAWLRRDGFDDGTVAEIILAVSEACNNVIEHAYNGDGPGPLLLRVEAGDGGVRVEIADRGRWLAPEPSDERGRGIHLMNGLMDRVEIETSADGTRIVLERNRGGTVSRLAAPVAQPSAV